MNNHVFAIDIGGTAVKMGLFDTAGNLLEKWEIPTRREDRGRHILTDVAAAVRDKCGERGFVPEELAGIGLGVPGVVTEGTTVNRCPNLGWGVVDVAAQLKALTGTKHIFVANDANLAALGEQWKGGGKGRRNMVMVTLGTGVGGGVVIDGKIVTGAFGAAGEIGHITVVPGETELCGCGKPGHLEQYASATGIVRLAHKALAGHPGTSVLGNLVRVTAKDVLDGAREGDAVCLKVLDQAAEALGRALAGISCVIAPEVFVIGGGVSHAGRILLDAISAHYRKYAFHAVEETEFALAELGNDAGIYGAVRILPGIGESGI